MFDAFHTKFNFSHQSYLIILYVFEYVFVFKIEQNIENYYIYKYYI